MAATVDRRDPVRVHRRAGGAAPGHRVRRLRILADLPAPRAAALGGAGLCRPGTGVWLRRDGQNHRRVAPCGAFGAH